jgi:transposase
MSRYDLTDFEWRVIEPLLPNKPRGVPRVDDRRVLNGIFRVLRSGAPWRDLPERFGPRTKSTSVSLDVQFAAEQSEIIRKRIIDSFPPQAPETFRNRVQQILKGYFLTGEILVCRIACETMWPERVSVKYDRILLEPNTLRGSMSIQNPTAIAIRCTRNTGAGFAFG